MKTWKSLSVNSVPFLTTLGERLQLLVRTPFSSLEPRPKRAKPSREDLMDQMNNSELQSASPPPGTPLKRSSSKNANTKPTRVTSRRNRETSAAPKATESAPTPSSVAQVEEAEDTVTQEEPEVVKTVEEKEEPDVVMTEASYSSAPPVNGTVVVKPPVDLPVDPNEPTYCICQQVSFGEMIAVSFCFYPQCDNEDCEIEWFHYPCVDLSGPPKGVWYCPNCTMARKMDTGKKPMEF